MMSRLRIASVGAGPERGQSWLQTMEKLTRHSDLYEFCGFCEVVPERRAYAHERWQVPGFSTLLELLDEARPDAVLNAVPPDSAPMTLGVCAPRGVHVISEIPIAPTLGMARWMVDRATEAAIVLEIAEQVWLWAQEQLKRKIIAEGLIGDVQHARLWYTNKADYHGINGVRMLVPGEIVRVLGATGEVTVPPFEHFSGVTVTDERWDLAVFEFDSGVSCIFESPPRARMEPRWDVEGTKGQISGRSLFIGGWNAGQEYPIIDEYTEADGEKVLERLFVDTDPPVVLENPYLDWRADSFDEVARMALLEGFHAAIVGGVEPLYGVENAMRDIEALFAMRESARRGEWVDLPLTEPTELETRIEEAYLADYGDWTDPESLVNTPFRRGGVRVDVANWD